MKPQPATSKGTMQLELQQVDQNKRRRKRQPKTQAYEKVTTYNHKPSWQFIMTVTLFVVQLAMHCVFVPRAIVEIDHAILYTMWGIHYLLIFIISVDYILITCFDPADGALKNPNYNLKFPQEDLRYCDICVKNVHKNSYHCMKCNRCTEQFDHHCKYLNNCIGSRNYESFLRILLIMIAYNLNIIGQGIWVFIEASNRYEIDSAAFSRWVVLALIILSFLILVTVSVLLGFHIYINCCVSLTTLEYLYQEQGDDINRDKKRRQNETTQGLKVKSQPKIVSAENLKFDQRNNF